MDAELEIARLDLERGRDALEAGRLLAHEGFHEDAVSRAYYAAFHGARAALTLLGVSVESHGGLKTMFGLHVVRGGHAEERLGRILSRLYDLRLAGDYDALTFLDAAEVEAALGEACEFVQAMEALVERLSSSAEEQGGPAGGGGSGEAGGGMSGVD